MQHHLEWKKEGYTKIRLTLAVASGWQQWQLDQRAHLDLSVGPHYAWI